MPPCHYDDRGGGIGYIIRDPDVNNILFGIILILFSRTKHPPLCNYMAALELNGDTTTGPLQLEQRVRDKHSSFGKCTATAEGRAQEIKSPQRTSGLGNTYVVQK